MPFARIVSHYSVRSLCVLTNCFARIFSQYLLRDDDDDDDDVDDDDGYDDDDDDD